MSRSGVKLLLTGGVLNNSYTMINDGLERPNGIRNFISYDIGFRLAQSTE